ncbi:hypothetical protein TRIP_B200308 [uncultured Desulfatiglans sp.]|uniref:Uncharacterized protein n=1 Tax=Uncultured Desulfatiglans sp. TaxID=1748965 RepID=A0A653A2J1_UNCDX|nr:hypothetical protein TRIP_B200308 [uncultured Desulfatiglans sp.]
MNNILISKDKYLDFDQGAPTDIPVLPPQYIFFKQETCQPPPLKAKRGNLSRALSIRASHQQKE